MPYHTILSNLPYTKPFLFVDDLVSITSNRVEGVYTFKADEYFYKGHFTDNPVTPGVILVECMAQIGLVCLGIFLLKDSSEDKLGEMMQIALSSHQMDFYTPVFPKERVTVISEKEYFRFNKLKCNVKMLNKAGEIVAKGTISGMFKN
ncbi:MAG: hydroxymyristoyl-ACP dehydratase [Flavobacteriaceae bacterium]|nr:hydroxymyristoyl-ACP dehydratase [Flavobacteriaceae bacterium]|tara:strand:- start:550 stop:993 length:444 start_codon:yes stop_codon:yes gene_type:complete